MRLLSKFQPGVYIFKYPIEGIDISIIRNVFDSICDIMPEDVDVLAIPDVFDFKELSLDSLVYLKDEIDKVILEKKRGV